LVLNYYKGFLKNLVVCGVGCFYQVLWEWLCLLDNWLVISFLPASYLNSGLVSEGALLAEESYQYDKGSIIIYIPIGFWLFYLRYFLPC
jgi:hypothetical protein